MMSLKYLVDGVIVHLIGNFSKIYNVFGIIQNFSGEVKYLGGKVI